MVLLREINRKVDRKFTPKLCIKLRNWENLRVNFRCVINLGESASYSGLEAESTGSRLSNEIESEDSAFELNLYARVKVRKIKMMS